MEEVQKDEAGCGNIKRSEHIYALTITVDGIEISTRYQ